ncbi:hypothetical protein N6H18_00305 [Reichenbachiella agarivorans]|uniref:MG2 domain-containing protein n=1 Tax=Reichenbachiella agarivorans TaxID=2979464 RepID=A0ABY6CPH2_9BACT|nr:hypothetical protein [Reichenbachiella agarivorans]UXP32416.1 hypothetical protein N6H18_00305 [Reichenbachiella agarivorans]
MIKKIVTIAILIFQFLGQSWAQQNIKEAAFLHLSASDLIVGETLYFSAFVSSHTTGRLSDLSNLLYVELMDAKGNAVHQTKIELDRGRGSGSIFLSSDLETNLYQIVAYTRWMKNFDSYYSQKIVIVNPYKIYEPLVVDEEKRKVSVSFYPEGGTVLSDIENSVLVYVRDQHNQGLNPKARILSANGEKVLDVNLDQYGLGMINFTPVEGEQYRLALEYQSSFDFYDLPVACAVCSHLDLTKILDNYRVKIYSSPDWETKTGRLEIWSVTGKVKEITTTLNTEQLITGSELPTGRITVLLYVDGLLVNERSFLHGRTQNIAISSVSQYGTREEVSQSYPLPVGTRLSVSVKKTYGNQLPEDITHHQIIPDVFKEIRFSSLDVDLIDRLLIAELGMVDTSEVDSVRYLPEYRSGIVQGRIVSETKNVSSKVNVALSFRGADYEIDATTVRPNGEFFLKYDPDFANDKGVVRVLNDPNNDYKVEIYPEYYEKYEPMTGFSLALDSTRLVQITERAIANQIENAYFEIRDSKKTTREFPEIDEVVTYTLADYTRFPTMRDTFIELIFEVGVSKNENKYAFNMRTMDIDYNDKNKVETMVLLDGAFSTAEDILKLSPYLVERIDVMNKRYFMGSVMFDGVIAVHTTDNNGGDTEPLGDKVNLVPVQSPVLDLKIDSVGRKPLFNDLLYWQSDITLKQPVLDLSFYTSDLTGHYELRIEGVTPEGEPISRSSYFVVK